MDIKFNLSNKYNYRELFLIDSLGALLTTFMLSMVLVNFESFFGMPKQVLYQLAVLASVFFVYSFTCYWIKPPKWKPFLRVIAIANLLYCILTSILIVVFFQQLTIWGILYFVIEILIIIFLAIAELKKTMVSAAL